MSFVKLPIKVKYHSETAKPISQAHPGEWCDLKTAEEIQMDAGEHQLISLGVSIQVPDGYEAIMAARSGTFGKYGLMQANAIGVIDETYCGNDDVWKWSAYATRSIIVPAGTRIAQFRVQEVQGELIIEEVDDMGNDNRGGLGSTGNF